MENKHKIITFVLLGFGMAIVVIFCAKKNDKEVTKSLFAMDTYMEITAYGYQSEEAVAAAVEEIERLDKLLSTGSDSSEITMLNHNKIKKVSEDTAYLIQKSTELWQLTDGAFDITIYPVMCAWGFAGGEYQVPNDAELSVLLEHVDASKLQFDAERNILTMPEDVEIDFGGIAKGYTSDSVAQILEEYGIKSAKLNLGGNVQTVGAKPDGSKWRIAIKSPYGTESYLGVISVENMAVITSGGYERYFEEDGNIYHHIIDPKTGRPAENGLVSVTIVSENGALADGLSTSLYVMGKNDAIAYWKAHYDEFDAVFLDEIGILYVTEGLRDSFTTKRDYEMIQYLE